jgi:hypothetical protein
MSLVAFEQRPAGLVHHHVKSRYGHDKEDLEILALVDEEFCISSDAHVKLVNPDGLWAIARHPLNQRGDEASILLRMKSVQDIGIIRDIRGGPWLVKHKDKTIEDRFFAVHWATLIQGAERARLADPNGLNKCVQMSLTAGLSKCKIYQSNTPDDVIRWLVELGNLLNSEATSITILEKWRCTGHVEPQWAAKRKDMNWTTSSLPAKVRDEKKFGFVCSLHKNRWSCYHAYEVTNTFYKESQKLMFNRGGTDISVWCALEEYVQRNVDCPKMNIVSDERAQQVAADAIRVLKDNPMWIVPVIALTLPTLGSDGRGPGKSIWLPNGLPLIIPTALSLQNLVLQMAGAMVLDPSLSPGDTKQAKTVPNKRGGGKKAKKPTIVAEDDCGEGFCGGIVDEKSPGTEIFLNHLTRTFAYLDKIDSSQAACIQAFQFVALFAALEGEVELQVRHAAKRVSSWSMLRQMMKSELYRLASLKPRPTDDDYAELMMASTSTPTETTPVAKPKPEDYAAIIEELGPVAIEVLRQQEAHDSHHRASMCYFWGQCCNDGYVLGP